MKKENRKESITMLYSLAKDMDEENSEVETENKSSIWDRLKGKFKKNKRENQYFEHYSQDDNKELVNEIAKDQDVNNIKKHIGTDQILDEICDMPFKLFKVNILNLNAINIEDEIYLIKKINEENGNYSIEDIIEKTLFIINKNKKLIGHEDNFILKIIRYKVLEKLISENTMPKISYKINEHIPFSNKRAILFFENGLLLKDSDIDLCNYSVQKIKNISKNYGIEYVQPFLENKFKNSNFISFGEIKEMIEIGLDINTIDNNGKNSLWYIKEIEDFNFLKEKGINLNQLSNKNENFLFEYISQITTFNFLEKEVLENVIKTNLNLNNINNKGENILFSAARKNIKCLHFLLNLNLINCYQLNNNGESILYFIEDKKTIDVLVNTIGFDINIINNHGENLLFNRSFDTVAMLIELGVNKKVKDFNGKTYLDRS